MREQAAQNTLASLEGQKARLKKALRFAETDAEQEEIMRDVRALQQQIDTATTAVEQAQLLTARAREVGREMLSHVEES